MDRSKAAQLLRTELDLHGLKDWSIRLNAVSLDSRHQYMGLCSYADKCIILNAHHVDLHEEFDILNTIRHEVAHALVGSGNGHNDVWASKAREVGCTHVAPCSYLGLPLDVIDAIRSGANVEVTFTEEVTTTRIPKYNVTRLQDRCGTCNKIAIIKNEILEEVDDDFKLNKKYQFLECGHLIIKWLPKATQFHTIIADGIDTCAHEWNNKTVCIKCGAKRPYDFQLEGMRFAESALSAYKGCVIMDEMGLGKTVQSLGLLKFHPELWPVLFVVKSGIKFQWGKEIMRWCGDEYFCQIISSSRDFLIPKLKGYIIGYDMLVPKTKTIRGKQVISGFPLDKIWERGIKTIVMDECQQIKNPDSTRTQQVRKLVGNKDHNIKVIGLSGTPWKNRGSEFFSILNMVAPNKFPSYQGYKDNWVSYYNHGDYIKEGGIKSPARFKEYIKDIAIRRERSEVMKELPLINRMKLHVQLDEFNMENYDDEVSNFVKWYNDAIIGGQENSLDGMNMLAKLSRMRHITGLAKIPATEEFIEQFFEENERKLVVFVHHVDVGNILLDNCKKKYGHKFPIFTITSDMDAQARFQVQEQFNKTEICLLIGSTLASGEGLNLQTCSDCVMHERQWNPANEEQAEGRFIRIGQSATSVGATYVEAEDTIDSLFDGIVEKKRSAFHEAMNTGDAPGWNAGDMMNDLAAAIVSNYQKKKGKPTTTAGAILKSLRINSCH